MLGLSESKISCFVLILLNIILASTSASESKTGVKGKGDFEDENYGVKYASKCEVCKIVSMEVEHQLNSKFKGVGVIDTGYSYLQDKNKRQTVYETSLIRLQEALESTCGAMLEYNIHKERKDWTRFARGQSQTFQTLHGLKRKPKPRQNKGVKVDLGIPDEMWDKPSAEVTQLKSQCDNFLETNEEAIEDWYQKRSAIPLEEHICKKTLPKKEQECLDVKPLESTPALPEKTSGKDKKPTTKKPKKSEL